MSLNKNIMLNARITNEAIKHFDSLHRKEIKKYNYNNKYKQRDKIKRESYSLRAKVKYTTHLNQSGYVTLYYNFTTHGWTIIKNQSNTILTTKDRIEEIAAIAKEHLGPSYYGYRQINAEIMIFNRIVI